MTTFAEKLKQTAEVFFIDPIENKAVGCVHTQLVAFGFDL
ncbi:hypothetical protein PSYMP_13764 [Pseudomonas amygdali pv. morsprunorum str. M302280]|nr:hypothetical protein PSYMP_13764 [Pseudomonas amygdali pv. morsprunorum str. M302280]EGH97783.1 hypothetical protein PLA106_16904 [Pseudomonas amygdali pv. lachrymans str. M302278]